MGPVSPSPPSPDTMESRWDNRAITTFSSNSEQVHVILMFRRGLRLELVAALGVAFAMPATTVFAESSRGLATRTMLTTETHDQGGHTKASLDIAVIGEDGLPVTGTVVIKDHGKDVAGVALDAGGHATLTVELPTGDHNLSAVYNGDAAHLVSASQTNAVHALASAAPDFSVSVAPATLSLKQGQSGSVTSSVTPVNAVSLTAPMFVTLSCSGLPDQTTCTFTPENVQILPNATAAVTSSMVIATQAASLAKASPNVHRGSSPVAWAVLLPGVLGLAGLAFGARRRRWPSQFVLLALVGFVTILGATACAPLYNYRNHGPPTNRPTPTGNYNVTVTAQSSNGITATTHNTTMALTVTQ